MQKYFSKLDWNKILFVRGMLSFSLMWSLFLWHMMIDISSQFQFTKLSMSRVWYLYLVWLTGQGPGDGELRALRSGLGTSVWWSHLAYSYLFLTTDRPYRIGAIVSIICLAELIIMEEWINKMRKLLCPPPATGQSSANILSTKYLITRAPCNCTPKPNLIFDLKLTLHI